MVIKQAHAAQSPVSSPAPAAKQAAKVVESGSFSTLLGKVTTPTLTSQPNYQPAGTIYGLLGTQSTKVSTSTSNPTPNPTSFTPTFIQGATVTSPDGTANNLNPDELATPSTAQQVAALLGGTVVQDNMSGNFSQSSPTLEISVPGSSVEINAGLAAKLFAQYGTAQGSQAWQIINRDLGRA